MIKLSFEYSQEFEVERIKSTLKRIDWYLANRYNLKALSFPEGFDLERLKRISGQELLIAVETEYDENKFIASTEDIKQTYQKYEPALEDLIEEIGLTPIPEVRIELTRYGISGSYHLPNEIIVNIARHYNIGLLRNVLHEIIHLHLEPLIIEYKIDQWGKETLVNLLFQRAFPELNKENYNPSDTTTLTKIFETHYPDIEKIVSLAPSEPVNPRQQIRES